GFRGIDRFQYVASDGLVLSNPATVTIRVIDPSGTPAVTAQPLVTEQGTALLNVVVGTILDGSPNPASSRFRATIDWGDGTTTPGILTAADSTLSNITGSHVYDVPGTYPITVTIQALAGGVTYRSSAPATVMPFHVVLGGTFVLPAGVPKSASGIPIT